MDKRALDKDGKAMRKFNLSLLAAAMGLLGLGACAGPAVHFTQYYPAYDHSEVRYASRNGALRVEAFGRLTLERDLDAEALGHAVAQTMSRHGPQWIQTDYATEAGETVDSSYKLRWLFNVPAGFPVASICYDKAPAKAPEWVESTGLVVAAFCLGEDVLSVTRGSLGPPRAGGAVALSELVGAMGRDLLPSRNPELIDDNCRRPSCG